MNSYIKYKILLTECRLLIVTYLYQNNNPSTESIASTSEYRNRIYLLKARTSNTNSNTALLTTNSQSNYIQLYTALAII